MLQFKDVFKEKVNIYKNIPPKLDIPNPKKVSVVIPNYNYEKYIIERIDSIVNQTYPIYELIIIDDCSKDNSVAIIENKIKDLKIKFPNLKLKFIKNEVNSGNVFCGWQSAFELSTGDYLWIAEADDSCSPIFLETIMSGFDNEKTVISYCESLTTDEKNVILMKDLRVWIDIFKCGKWNQSYQCSGLDELRSTMCINNTIANVSSAVFKKLPNVDYDYFLRIAQTFRLAGDWYFYSKILECGDVAYFKESLNYHRMQKKSVTLTTSGAQEFREICRMQNYILNAVDVPDDVKKLVYQRRENERLRFGLPEDGINLSIIVPVYNTEKYLEKCLDSILVNIPEHTELLVINDGSPDNSEKIIKKYQEKYKDIIKYFKKPNGGLSDTKNFGISKASGKYVTFVDSDDYVDKYMHQEMLDLALSKDADVVYCDVEKVFEDGGTSFAHCTNIRRNTEYFKLIDTPLMATSCNKLIKKELYNGFTFPVGLINEDITVTPILLAKAKSIYKIDKPFYKYFHRSNSIQNSTFNEKRFEIFDAVKLCFEQAKSLPEDMQIQLRGAIYTHQLLAYLIYLISALPEDEQNKLIPIFCQKYNEFGEDGYQNTYVKEYVRKLYAEDLPELIKKEDTKAIIAYLKKCKEQLDSGNERKDIDLSIIIPVYNTEKYIEKCLKSVLKNIPENTELIIVNDGSPDNAESIIKKFADEYTSIIRYYKKPNGGLSDAKNFGISKAMGRYITFVDSDDYIDENMHKDMLKLAIKKEADIVYCDVEQIYENGDTEISYCTNFNRDTDYFKLIDAPLMAASWNKIIKKELYDGFSFPVGVNNEDIAVTPILLARAKSIYKINKPFYKYFQRSGSIQNSGFTEKRFVIFEATKICFENAKNLPEEIQLQIRGSIYTHQILALLIYPIAKLTKEEKLKLIPIFCEKFNEFGDDPYNNKYVQEYEKKLHLKHLFKLIRKCKTKQIIGWLKYYRLIRLK